MTGRTASPRRDAFALAALALLAACGGGESPPRPATPSCGTPGAGWVAFAQQATGPFAIVVAHEDGSCARTAWAGTGNAGAPSWSAQAHALAFSGSDAGETAIRVHDLVTGLTSTVATAPLVPGNVALSPDGSRLAFDAAVGGGNPDVYVVPVSGGDPVVIGSSAASDAGPAWSADGQTVYFTSNRLAGRWDLWSAAASGLVDPVQVTSGSKVLGVPAVSPDGHTIAYARKKPDSTSQIIGRVLDTGEEWVVTDQRDGEPAFDATGRRVAVTTSRWGGADVAIVDVNSGAVLTRVTEGTGLSGAPAFPR